MSNVVKLFKPNTEAYWTTGQANCSKCSHTWVAVVEGTPPSIECPSCNHLSGALENSTKLSPNNVVWTCVCGTDTFHITPTGHICTGCNNYQTY